MKTSIKFLAGAVAALLVGATSLRANQVTVQELAFDPGVQIANISVPGFYTGGVYAGINHLSVDGQTMNGFCIDPFHFSSASPLLYDVVSLDQAPKAPGTMDAAQAAEVSNLWAQFYSADMSESNAAGMQIAIWEIVAGNQITIAGSDYGATKMIESLTAYTGVNADLVGLTGPGQDYVVQRTSGLQTPRDLPLHVPDQGSTLALLGMASMALLVAGAVRGKIPLSVLGC